MRQHTCCNGRGNSDDHGPQAPAKTATWCRAAIIQGFDFPIGKPSEAYTKLAGLSADEFMGLAFRHCRKIMDVSMAMVAKALLIGSAHAIPVLWT